MMLDMVLGCLIAVANGLLCVAMRNERLMRGMRIVFLGVVSRGFAMMQRGLLMMRRRRVVMLGARICFVHAILRCSMVMPTARAGRRLAAGHGFPTAISGKNLKEAAALGPDSLLSDLRRYAA